jgi:hypothetical protein
MSNYVRRFGLALVAGSFVLTPQSALAWGDEGHKIIALVADRFLENGRRWRGFSTFALPTSRHRSGVGA